eukprot:jgi/Mesvir1/6057/Mv00790-RA.1
MVAPLICKSDVPALIVSSFFPREELKLLRWPRPAARVSVLGVETKTWKKTVPSASMSEGLDADTAQQPRPCAWMASDTRRLALAKLAVGSASILGLEFAWAQPAVADAGTLTLQDVSPPVAPAGKLLPSEEAMVRLFEANTYSVVNVVDVTLTQGAVRSAGGVEIPEGNGTGIVWDTQGRIITNYHVIGNVLSTSPAARDSLVARVTVVGVDGVQQTYNGRLVAADRSIDLAVLQINAPPSTLRPVTVGTSSSLRVGQRCLAIGNPFGFDHTLTVGIISGLDRDIQSQAGTVISGGIQTDAAINPGNSGGPLLDSQGRLVGINTAIFTRTGTSSGVGFAIPIDTVARVVPQLINAGKLTRAGLNAQFASERVAKQLQITKGALILSLPSGGAAIKAGLLATRRGLGGNIVAGDVITGVDKYEVKSPKDLFKVLDGYNVGDTVVLKVERLADGSDKRTTVEIQVTLETSGSS